MKYDDGLDDIATAMANAGRRQIVDRLRDGDATTSELAAMLRVGLPATMKQVDLLVVAGVVHRAKHGRTVRYTLDTSSLVDYSTWLSARRSFWQGQLAALDTAVVRRD